MSLPFIHLRVHSAYSLAEGAIKIKDFPKLCQQHGMPAVGLTDSMNLFGALEFALTCASAGVQPIVGCQAILTDEGASGSIILLVQTEKGYKNLLHLISQAYLRSVGPERVTLHLDDFKERSEGLIALTGGADGLLAKLLIQNDPVRVQALCEALKALFPGSLYIELERHGLALEEQLEPQFLRLADSYDFPLVATNNTYFATPDLYEAHDVLLCVAEGTTISQPQRRQVTSEHHFKSTAAMVELFADIPEAIANTLVIAQRCGFMPKEEKPILPPFRSASGRDEKEELRHQAILGLTKRLQDNIQPIYQERLEEELGIIESMGFSGYFLIVADFIQWARQQGIPVGPGRGSGAGSVVAWSLTITDIDPIRFQLIFERFLNPERVSMPDFDIDFCQDRRDEVIQYVCEKYGAACVAHIITFGKLQARAVLRDAGRVLEMSYTQVDKICKMIPNNPANPTTLEQALALDPLLRQAREEDSRVDKLLEMGMKLEGLYRHASTHAAGIVIGGTPLVEMIPLYKDDRSLLPVTQFSMKYVELAGLLKFDFLGLKTLTVIEKCCELIRARGISIEISEIPLDDPATYALLVRVEAVGVFQLESAGMRDVLRRLRPDRFEDLIALVALYRPGPMDDIPRYLACKHGEEAITYLHPALQPILEPTYGVMVYQEQVMKIAQVLGGYSLGAADLLRRAMGKKIKAEMDAQRTRFVEGAITRGVESGDATQIFEAMAKFAGYGFNKSHAAPYALLSYQTAYLKANYPLEFFASSMTLDLGNTDKLMIFRQDLQRLQISLYPPDINISEAHFMVDEPGIRYALGAIKNVGEHAMRQLVAERQRGGSFKNIEDFALRIDARVLNKRQLEGLIAAGAFDSLHKNRRQLFLGAEAILKYAHIVQDEKKRQQGSLFTNHTADYQEKIVLPPEEEWSHLEKLQYEFQALGFFLSAHPLEAYQSALKRLRCISSSDLPESSDGSHCLAGVILTKQERTSKTGQKFAFIQCSDSAGFFEVAIFSEVFLKVRSLLQPGQLLFFQVSARRDGEGIRLNAQDVQRLEDVLSNTQQKLQITATSAVDLQSLQQLLLQLPNGKTHIEIQLQLPTQLPARIVLPSTYAVTAELRERLGQITGVEDVCDLG